MGLKLSQNDFIDKCNAIHDFKFDYSKVVYINLRSKIEIICSEHGIFWQKALSHLQGHGCKKCYDQKMSFDEFRIRANQKHDNKYQYPAFKNHNKIIEIICQIHGSFEQNLFNHLNGNGCYKCFIDRETYDNDIFIKKSMKIHDDKYIYSKVDYTYSTNNVIIVCKIHGDFKQLPAHHLRGVGCPACAKTISQAEIKWLDSLNIPLEFRHLTVKIDNRLFKPDAIDIANSIIYEFYGDFWHGNPSKYDPEDINLATGTTFKELYNKTIEKEQVLKQNGYEIISKWESDFEHENIE